MATGPEVEKKYAKPAKPEKLEAGAEKEAAEDVPDVETKAEEVVAEKPAETATPTTTAAQTQAQAAEPPVQKNETVEEIEGILAENLEDIFMQLSPDQQQSFKAGGETTAQKIYTVLQKTKVRIKEILGLIKDWLKIIPGVNKFFLEQEAKIKTEKILKLKK